MMTGLSHWTALARTLGSLSAVAQRFRRTVVALLNALEHEAPASTFWSRPHRWLAASLLCLQLVLSSVGIDGFSLPIWHELIDGSAQHEVLVGRTRDIRGDDWNAVLPLHMAQTSTYPRLPATNPTVGMGQDMHIITGSPVLDFSLAFRPAAWGFVVGRQFGLSWMWWARVLGLFYAVFLVVYILSERRFILSFFAAAAFVWSPYLQFWSLNAAEIPMYGLLAFVFFAKVVGSRTSRAAILSGAGLGWIAVAFGITMYPPGQLAVAYVIVSLALASLWERRREMNGVLVLAGLALAGIIIAAAMSAFWFVSEPAFSAMQHTVYPGARVSVGGQIGLAQLFDNLSVVPSAVRDWSPVGNICEAARFFYMFPVLTLALMQRRVRNTLITRPLFWAAALSTLLLLAWAVVGFPHWFANLSLFSRIPPTRAQIALGLSNVIWIGLFLAWRTDNTGQGERKSKAESIVSFVGFAAWTALLVHGAYTATQLPGLETWERLGIVTLWIAVSALLLTARRSFLVAHATLSFALTAFFNPVVYRGSDFLYDNPLSQKVLELSLASPRARWAVFNSVTLPNLLRVLGVPGMNGVLVSPQLEMWKLFDPEETHRHAYNRYAHVILLLGERDELRFETPYMDVFRLTVDPRHPAFRRLGVDYLLVEGDTSKVDATHAFVRVFDYAGKSIFARDGNPPRLPVQEELPAAPASHNGQQTHR